MPKTITRKQYIEAVEEAIRHADRADAQFKALSRYDKRLSLTRREKLTLRTIAATGKRFAVTTYERFDPERNAVCGCPLTQAGLYNDRDAARRLGNFATPFDSAVAKALGGWPKVPSTDIVEVQD